MSLTVDQKVEIRRQIGNAPADADLEVIYTRTASLDETVLEVLEIRLAEMRRNPESFSVPGEYSESRSAAQRKELLAQINGVRARLGLDPLTSESLSLARVVPPPDPKIR